MTYNSGMLDEKCSPARWHSGVGVDGIWSVMVNTAAGTVINVNGMKFGGSGVHLFESGMADPRAYTSTGVHRIAKSRSSGVWPVVNLLIQPAAGSLVFEPITAVRMRQSL